MVSVFWFMVSLERAHAAGSGVRVAAGVREIEKRLVVAIRILRMLWRKKSGSRVQAVGESEVARLHPPPFAPVAVEFGEVAVEEHPPAGESVESIRAAEIDQGRGDACVGQQAVGHPVPGHPPQGFAPLAPRSIVEEHGAGMAGQAGRCFRGNRERVAQLRRHLPDARPSEVDHDLAGELGDQWFEFPWFESLEPADFVVFPPRQTGTVGVCFVAGIEGFSIRTHIGRAYKDYTHGFRWVRGWRRESGNRSGGTSGRRSSGSA